MFWKRRPVGKKGHASGRQSYCLPSRSFERNQLAPSVEFLEARCLLSAAPTTITVASSAASITHGQSISLTATVASTITPSEGTVAFMDGSTVLGTQPVSGGTATLSNVLLPVGIDAITATYSDPTGSFATSGTTLGPGSIIQTVAGNGTVGYGGDGSQATASALNNPTGIAVDSAGDLFIADQPDNVIREVNAVTHAITTVAGGGTSTFSGYVGDEGPATAASLNDPSSIAVDSSGDLFIADTGDKVIREVNALTQIITTVAGDFYAPPLNIDNGGASGEDASNGDNGAATAATLYYPTAIALDAAGDLFIADSESSSVREVNAVTHVITTIAGNGNYGYSGDGGPATAATLNAPWGIATDSAGDVFIADTGNHVVREVNAVTHVITTVAGNGHDGDGDGIVVVGTFVIGGTVAGSASIGDGGQATDAALDGPTGITVDASGDLFIAESSDERIREVNAVSQIITTVAGSGAVQFTGIVGNTIGASPLYTGAYGGDGGPATSAELNRPAGLAVDSAGNLFIADTDNDRIREVSAGAIVTVSPAPTAVSPSSSVAALPLRTSQTSIPVSWSGTAGSGGPIASYDISVSIDGGPFTPWLTDTALTSATYAATLGHTYAFVSQAVDADGDVESAHATADATVTTAARPWQNPGNPLDVLGTGGPITPADVLALIDYLNSQPATNILPPNFPAGSLYLDILGTGTVGPGDALALINYLNTHTPPSPSVSLAVPLAVSPAAVSLTVSLAVSPAVPAISNPDISLPAPAPNAAPMVSPAVVAAGQAGGASDSGAANSGTARADSISNPAVASSLGAVSQPSAEWLARENNSIKQDIGRASAIDALLGDSRLKWLED